MDKLAEVAGFGLIVGFLWFVWPPLTLLGLGVLLVVWANTRTHKGNLGAVIGASIAAAKRAYAVNRLAQVPAEQLGELRRVS